MHLIVVLFIRKARLNKPDTRPPPPDAAMLAKLAKITAPRSSHSISQGGGGKALTAKGKGGTSRRRAASAGSGGGSSQRRKGIGSTRSFSSSRRGGRRSQSYDSESEWEGSDDDETGSASEKDHEDGSSDDVPSEDWSEGNDHDDSGSEDEGHVRSKGNSKILRDPEHRTGRTKCRKSRSQVQVRQGDAATDLSIEDGDADLGGDEEKDPDRGVRSTLPQTAEEEEEEAGEDENPEVVINRLLAEQIAAEGVDPNDTVLVEAKAKTLIHMVGV